MQSRVCSLGNRRAYVSTPYIPVVEEIVMPRRGQGGKGNGWQRSQARRRRRDAVCSSTATCVVVSFQGGWCSECGAYVRPENQSAHRDKHHKGKV